MLSGFVLPVVIVVVMVRVWWRLEGTRCLCSAGRVRQDGGFGEGGGSEKLQRNY